MLWGGFLSLCLRGMALFTNREIGYGFASFDSTKEKFEVL